VTLNHDATSSFYDDTRTIPLDFSSNSAAFTLIVPAYYMQNGDDYGFLYSIQNNPHRDGCLVSVERFREPAQFPFLITWRIPEQWRTAQLHQRILLSRD
jgi:hypothetical protein